MKRTAVLFLALILLLSGCAQTEDPSGESSSWKGAAESSQGSAQPSSEASQPSVPPSGSSSLPAEEEDWSMSETGVATYSDPYRQLVYEAFTTGPAKTGDEVSAVYEDCTATVYLLYPEIFAVKEEGDRIKIFAAQYAQDYCFFTGKDGNTVRFVTGVSIPVGLVCEKDKNGTLSVLEKWMPGDGTRYAEDIEAFCGGDTLLAQKLEDCGENRPVDCSDTLEDQLKSYMKHNGMTGYRMQSISDSEKFFPFGD